MSKFPKNDIVLGLWHALIATLLGLTVGAIGAGFVRLFSLAVAFRAAHPFMMFLLPAVGALITFLYAKFYPKDGGTNRIIRATRGERDVPHAVAPLILTSSILTQLVGGSAGREGVAVQFGSGVCSAIAALFHIESTARKRLYILCGMSAGFSAVFGTPLAAAIFAIEVATVGLMELSALFPCMMASLAAYFVSDALGVARETYDILERSPFTVLNLAKVFLLAFLCGLCAKGFCLALSMGGKLLRTHIKNEYLRTVLCSAVLIAVFFAEGSGDFCGTGAVLIDRALEGTSQWYAFLLKAFVTILTLKGGFKGGEILPSLSIGASLGCVLAPVVGMAPSMCAAVMMVSFFAAATNCPITALLLGVELFDGECAPFFLLAIAVAFFVSGKTTLYHAQDFDEEGMAAL